jgi:hypothetical protein
MAIFKLIQDENTESPREWDNLGTMVSAHRKYNLGDENSMSDLAELIVSHKNFRESYREEYCLTHLPDLEKLAVKMNVFAVILPLYLYDHSGITMSTSPFSCSWDSGKVGFIYVTKEQLRTEFSVKRITQKLIERTSKILEGEVETYDQFLTGDIYGFQITDDEDEVIESCWGFYGSDVEKNGMLEHIDDKYHELAKAA